MLSFRQIANHVVSSSDVFSPCPRHARSFPSPTQFSSEQIDFKGHSSFSTFSPPRLHRSLLLQTRTSVLPLVLHPVIKAPVICSQPPTERGRKKWTEDLSPGLRNSLLVRALSGGFYGNSHRVRASFERWSRRLHHRHIRGNNLLAITCFKFVAIIRPRFLLEPDDRSTCSTA